MNHMTCGQSYSDYMNEPQTACIRCCMDSEELNEYYLCPNCVEHLEIERQFQEENIKIS